MAEFSKFPRRDFLKVTGAGLAVAGMSGSVAMPSVAAGTSRGAGRPGKPRRIIFMVSDGMSQGVVSLTDHFAKMQRGTGSVWTALMAGKDEAIGFFETHSLSSMVTDSAAAATAWGSGSRVANGAINMLPDKTELVPVASLVKDAGRAMGLVTTTRITHATPAGFASVVPDRGMEDEIAPQYIDKVDVLMGGGLNHFDASSRDDNHDLLADYKANGYEVIRTRDELQNLTTNAGKKVLGLFYDSHLPYTIDQINDPELEKRVPTLAEMTRAALETLRHNPDGFLLQVEGGRVDHAAHGNDAAAIMWDQLAFDDAIAVALEFARQEGDTLVVVTTDHGNANPGLNGMGGWYNDSTECFERLALAKHSFEWLSGQLNQRRDSGESITGPIVRDLVKEMSGLEISNGDAVMVASMYNGGPQLVINSSLRNFSGLLGQVLGNHNGIQWIGTAHTEDMALITAYGPGSADFAGMVRNTDAFHHIMRYMDIDFTNPTMTPDDAKKFLAYAPAFRKPDWA